MIWIIAAVFVAFIVVAVVVYIVSIYNGFIRLMKNIDKAWANIEVILKQRHDELPKLIEVCKGYMKYERSVLEEITKLRSAWMKAKSMGERASISEAISGALKTLFAVSERYPRLRANENFLHLQSRISGLETELADRREFYNDSVTLFNTRLHWFPDMYMARAMKLKPAELFKVTEEEKKEVAIKF